MAMFVLGMRCGRLLEIAMLMMTQTLVSLVRQEVLGVVGRFGGC